MARPFEPVWPLSYTQSFKRAMLHSERVRVKSDLMEELVRLSQDSSRIEIEKGRVLPAAGEQILREAGVAQVTALHRHGPVVDAILEREDTARVLVLGKRGVGYEFKSDHIGSMIERVVGVSAKPALVASREYTEPGASSSPLTLAQPPIALERLANSPLLTGLPNTIVMAEAGSDADQAKLANAEASFRPEYAVTAIIEHGKAEQVIPGVVPATEGALLLMGA